MTRPVGCVITCSQGRSSIKRGTPHVQCIFLPSFERFDAPSSDFYSFLLLFLCFSAIFLCFSSVSFCFSAVMDFPHVPKDLGDDLGAGASSFSFEDFDLDDMSFPQAVARTSSTAGPLGAIGVSGGSSSHPRLSRGDPIPVTYSLETHAWITHRRPISFLLSLHVICFSSFS